ncbi:MAG: AMP-binding protein [Treponema sp.]|nr:AMP-binding protein [Treponema sp.]
MEQRKSPNTQIEAAHTTLAQLCLDASAKHKNKIAFSMICEDKLCREVTYTQMGNRAKQIAFLLREMGVNKGDKVLLLSENCPEWALAYFGIALAGAVSVPLLTGFTPEQISHIMKHSKVKAVCVSRALMDKIDTGSQVPVFCIDEFKESENIEVEVSISGDPNALATIIYTSGTQGSSKGVMLSSKNIISSALSSLFFKKVFPRDRFLSVLPLAHSYECSIGFLAAVLSGASITYLDRPPSSSVLLPAVKLIRPTVMITVPLLIEKVFNNAIAPKLRKNALYKFPPTRLLAVRVAGRKLKKALGGCIRVFGIGGAALSPQVEKFLYDARFPYTIGYGLTETAPLVAGNTPLRFSFGSGISAPRGVKLRIEKVPGITSDEGEIQVQGPNVMLGYYDDDEKTAETFTQDGWLRTGDLGKLDGKGRLHIKGRLKALILGPSGENIYPEEIEKLLGSSQLIEESIVYSGQKGEIVALVRLSEAAKTAAGAIEQTLEDLRTWVNKQLAAFSRISKIEVKQDPFEKTPTMKIKRYLYI